MENRELSNFIESYLNYTEDTESPETLHFWTALAILSGALKRQVFMNRGSAYKLYPNLYIIIVGESAKIKKSLAMDTGIDLLQSAVPDIFIMKGRMTPEGLVKNMERTVVVKTGDLNPDGSPRIIMRAESHTFIHANELATLFGYDRLSASRLAILLTETYGCPSSYPHTTKTDAPIIVHNLYTTLLAGTDPRNLKVLPEDAIGGFLGRTIFVTANKRRKKVPWPELGVAELKTKLVIDLARISSLKGEFIPTAGARKAFDEWYDKFSDIEVDDPRLEAFHERAHDTALKIAMLLSVSVTNTLILEEDHVKAGIKIVERQMVEFTKSLEWNNVSAYAQNRAKIMDLLLRHGGIATRKVLMRAMELTKDEMAMLLESMEEEGKVIISITPTDTIVKITPDEIIRLKKGNKPTTT